MSLFWFTNRTGVTSGRTPAIGEKSMKIVRVYTGDDGESHFEDVEVQWDSESSVGKLSRLIRGSGVIFRHVEKSYDLDFHVAPRRQFVVNLIGSVDISVGDGTTRRIGSGEILLAEDTTGRGHKSRAVDGGDRTCLFIPIDSDEEIFDTNL